MSASALWCGVEGNSFCRASSAAGAWGAGSRSLSSLPLAVSGRSPRTTNRGRDHVARQGRLQRGAQPVHVDGLGCDVRDQLRTGRGVVARDHRARAYAGLPQEDGLDLARLDSKASDLDLVVRAPEKLDGSVQPEPAEVAGAIDPVARVASPPVGDESLGGARAIPHVALGEVSGANADLAELADASRLPVGVDRPHSSQSSIPLPSGAGRPSAKARSTANQPTACGVSDVP